MGCSRLKLDFGPPILYFMSLCLYHFFCKRCSSDQLVRKKYYHRRDFFEKRNSTPCKKKAQKYRKPNKQSDISLQSPVWHSQRRLAEGYAKTGANSVRYPCQTRGQILQTKFFFFLASFGKDVFGQSKRQEEEHHLHDCRALASPSGQGGGVGGASPPLPAGTPSDVEPRPGVRGWDAWAHARLTSCAGGGGRGQGSRDGGPIAHRASCGCRRTTVVLRVKTKTTQKKVQKK